MRGLPEGEDQKRAKRGHQIVEHDAKSTFVATALEESIAHTHGAWFGNVKKAKKQKGH
jgi:hypothetical protein